MEAHLLPGEDIITDKQGIPRDITGETGRVTPDVKRFEAFVMKVPLELLIKSKNPCQRIGRVKPMDPHGSIELLSIEIGGARESAGA